MELVKLGKKGQVSIPAALMRRLGLEGDSWLIAETSADDPANGQEAQRRYDKLTDRGWRTLRSELSALSSLVDHARANARLRKGLA